MIKCLVDPRVVKKIDVKIFSLEWNYYFAKSSMLGKMLMMSFDRQATYNTYCESLLLILLELGDGLLSKDRENYCTVSTGIPSQLV